MMCNDVKNIVKDHLKRLNLSEELHIFSFLVQVKPPASLISQSFVRM